MKSCTKWRQLRNIIFSNFIFQIIHGILKNLQKRNFFVVNEIFITCRKIEILTIVVVALKVQMDVSLRWSALSMIKRESDRRKLGEISCVPQTSHYNKYPAFRG